MKSSIWGGYLLKARSVGDAKHNPLSRIESRIPVKHLVYSSVIVHHVDSLCIPLHCEILADIIVLRSFSVLHAGRQIAESYTGHNALHLFQLYLHISGLLHLQTAPRNLVKAILQSHIAQGAVVCRSVCLQIGSQIRSILIVERIVGKGFRQGEHVPKEGIVCPDNPRIVIDGRLIFRGNRQRQDVLLILVNQVLNGQNRHRLL